MRTKFKNKRQRTFSVESRLKISKALKGRKLSNKTKLKMSKAQTGKTLSEKTKKKMSKARMGKNNPNYNKKPSIETRRKMKEAQKGKNNHNYGKKFSEGTKLKMSLVKIGSNHPNWKGGISCEPYCFDWTKEYKDYIKERDNHECQNPDCWHNQDDKPLHVHHIDYIKKNCLPKNLITLCLSCNVRANKNRKQHTKFYQEIIKQKYTLKEAA